MSLNGDGYECPVCKSQGKRSLVRPLQINVNHALIGCEDPECWYPLGIDNKSLLVKRSYKALGPYKANQVTPTTSLASDDFEGGPSISANVCSDSILDDFQLDALLQDCSVQLDDDFCRDFNSFLNCENQESVQTEDTSVTIPQELDLTGIDSVLSASDPMVPSPQKDFDFDQDNKTELPRLPAVSTLEDFLATQNNIETLENTSNEIPTDSNAAELDNTPVSRDISERFTDNNRKHGNVGSIASKVTRPLLGRTVSPPKSSLSDAMKNIHSDVWDIDQQITKQKRKPKRGIPNKRKAIVKPNLEFVLC